jgi:hypothetical protein
MEHNDIRHRLSEFIDGSVTDEERAMIEAHLETCTECSQALQELRKTLEHIKTVEEIDPPAWMAQKIMTTVRAEAGKKRPFLQRMFYPLMVKLPVQAIAVLFLAVTGFYIYQNIQPASRLSEAPSSEFGSRGKAPSTVATQDKLAKADGPAVRSKQVPQTPAYKSLDMKLEYENPAKPTLKEQAAAPAPSSAPAKPSALAKNEDRAEKRDAEPQAVAPKMMQEQPSPSAGMALQGEATGKSGTAKQQRSPLAADGSTSNARGEIIDNQFQLAINQTISFAHDHVRLKLLKVTEDSRCPSGVRCAWEGQVTVLIQVMKQDQHIADVSLTLRAGNHEELATNRFDNYTIKLVKVSPHPESGNTIRTSDYRATLSLSKL